MLRRTLMLALVLPALAGAAACSNEDPAPSPTATTPAGGAVTGPTPALGGAVLALVPEHGTSIAQPQTKTLDPSRPQPPCFTADLTSLPQQAQWFRMLLDGREVTLDFTWIVPTTGELSRARACYAKAEGIAPGSHTITIVVKDPLNAAAPPKQTVQWAFTVTP